MIMYTGDGHIGWFMLVSQHIDVAVHSLLDAHPVDGIAVGTPTSKTLPIIDKNDAACGTLVTHTIPIVQGACKLAASRDTAAYVLRSAATGFGQKALVAIVAQYIGIQ